ncbi:MAG: choice-of-anchor D domain-containing protein [bacterium]|nr:choice-of-anchor D domain-containing protein [Candidatus Kapabacteria bacterium]
MTFLQRLTSIALLIMLVAASNLTAQVTPQISLNPEFVDFGNVQLGDTVRRSITVSNSSTVAVLTGSATPSKAYYLVDSGATFAVPSNGSRIISIRFIPTMVGSHSDSLVIIHNATNRTTPIYVTMRAVVDSAVNAGDTNALVISPNSVNFGTVRPGEFADRTITVRNSSTRQIAGSVGATVLPFIVTSGSGPFILAAGQSHTITMRFAPTSNGVYNDTLAIAYTDSGFARTRNVMVSGRADSSVVVRNDTTLTVTPSVLDYGNVPAGESFDRSFVIRNATERTVAGSVGAAGAPFAALIGGGPFALAPGATRTVLVRFTPLASGTYSDSVVVSFADTMNVARTTAVRLIGRSDSTARPADTALVVSPTFIEYGTVTTGSSQSRSFTVRNQSNRAVSGFVGTSAAPFVVTSGAGPFMLTPNQTLTVNVQFTPTTNGDFSGNVPVTYVNDDTTGARTVYVILHGRSDTASTVDSTLVVVTPTSLSFSSITIGTTADRSFTIRNRTNSPLTGGVTSPTSGAYMVTTGGGVFTLAPGEERMVTVRFAPTVAREYRDSVMAGFTNASGTTQTVTISLVGNGGPPAGIDASASRSNGLSISHVAPNPMRESVRIEFATANTARVVVEIYDINGAKVATLIDEQRTAGSQSVVWNPSGIASGSYVYRVIAGSDVVVGQILYQK